MQGGHLADIPAYLEFYAHPPETSVLIERQTVICYFCTFIR